MKSLRSVLESTNVVNKLALYDMLKEFNIDEDCDQCFIDMMVKDYNVAPDMAEALVKAISDAALDNPEGFDKKFADDLNADKTLRRKLRCEYYIGVVNHKDAFWVLPLTNQSNKLEKLLAVLDNIKWDKGAKWDVIYNFTHAK